MVFSFTLTICIPDLVRVPADAVYKRGPSVIYKRGLTNLTCIKLIQGGLGTLEVSDLL